MTTRCGTGASPKTRCARGSRRWREPNPGAALTGSNFWIRTVLLAERKAARPALNANAAPVYAYSLDWRSPACDGRLKAHHAMDLPFVFDTTDVPDTTRGATGARELAAVVSAIWVGFARTGSPGHPA